MYSDKAQTANALTAFERFVPLRAPVSKVVFVDFVRLADALAMIACAILAYLVYTVGVQDAPLAVWEAQFTAATLVGVAAGVTCLSFAGVYDFERLRNLPFQLARSSVAWTAALALLLLLAFMTKSSAEFSRGWFVVWFLTSTSAISVVRYVSFRRIQDWHRSGRLQTAVAVVGAGEEGIRAIRGLRAVSREDIQVVGVFDDRNTRRPTEVEGVPVLGSVGDLIEAGKSKAIDKIIIALPVSAEQRIKHIAKNLQQLPADIDLSLDVAGREFLHSGIVQIGSSPFLRLVTRPLSDWHAVAKNLEDKMFSLLVLLLCAPVLAGIAIAIKVDSSGPALFRQRRFGFNNQEIVVYKFRSMFHDRGDQSGAKQTVRNDPRVTRVGRFLRKTNLDELPQFINVLQGRLSVVGPRPHALTMKAADKLYHEAVDDYAVRHRVKPGITGWAQVNGLRGETDTMEKATKRIAHDLHYIDNWSLLFDAKIILLTVIRGFNDPNAY